jgi:hypothetical protein
MANSDKNILITTSKNQTSQPRIDFVGGDNTPVSINVDDDGSLIFSGAAGQLFAITNDLSGTIFSVNDISGVPSLEVTSDGAVRIAPYTPTTNPVLVGRGTSIPGSSAQLQVEGGIHVGGTSGYSLPATDGNSGQVLVTNGSGALAFADAGTGGGGGEADLETIIAYSIALG